MNGSDLLVALTPVVQCLEALGVPYYLGGSVASSTHGVPRSSLDADVVADLDLEHVTPFVTQLREAFYLDEDRVRTAVEARRSFNLIHLATMFKIDVFASKRRAFDREAQARARPWALDAKSGSPLFLVASAEDTVLAKLEWFRAGGEVSDRQWSDIVGVVRVRSSAIDWRYLERWANVLGVRELLDHARAEVGGER